MAGVMASGEKGILSIVAATHAGMTTDEFEKAVAEWIATAHHPQSKRLYTTMVYQLIDDKEGKPVGIESRIGRRAICPLRSPRRCRARVCVR